MLPTALCLLALVASALGSPSSLEGHNGGLQAKAYTVQVRRGLVNLGPGALVNGQFAVCSAHLVDGVKASRLSIKAGTDLNFPINIFGESVEVSDILLHPGGADVAVLVLAKAVTVKSASSIPLVGPQGAQPGSLVQVSGWGPFKLSVDKEWLVQPRYCAGNANANATIVCATGTSAVGNLLVSDGQLIGLGAGKGQGSEPHLSSFLDLAEPTVQKFIALATQSENGTTTAEPSSTVVPSTAAPTEAPANTTTAAPVTSPTSTAAPSTTHSPSGQICSISTSAKGMPTNEPVLLRGDATNGPLSFQDPSEDGTITLAAGESITVLCSGKSNYVKLAKPAKQATVQCVTGSTFKLDGKSVQWSALGCASIAYHSARRAGNCGSSGQFNRIEIGFEAESGFAMQIENCFDGTTFDAVYSRSNLTAAIAGHESGAARPKNFQPDFFEGIEPKTLYTNKVQKSTVGTLLGDADLGDKYIKPSGSSDYYLARGHLSAKADHILGVQQRATFYYINVAPQWQTFNGKNWENLESSVRSWVMDQRRSVQVITGTWGVATLPNKDGVETELYLAGSKKMIRVPKYYWKVVYDPITQEGAAFVGLNNPYHATTEEDIFCDDICARYSWLTWDQKNDQRGYGFCCDIQQFRKTVTTLPDDVQPLNVL